MVCITKRHAAPIKLLFLALAIHLAAGSSQADDTDLYSPSVQHNVVINLDTSGSMNNKVYESFIDYQDFFEQIVSDYGSNCAKVYHYETGCPPYGGGLIKDRIYMFAVPAGYDGVSGAVGDIGYRGSLLDYPDVTLYDTGTTIDPQNNLNGGDLSIDPATGHILYNGQILPNNRDLAANAWQTNPDNTRINTGFIGQIQAPGFYFSGYFPDNTGTANQDQTLAKTSGAIKWAYFFATGNYLNFHRLLLLETYPLNRWEWASDVETYSSVSLPDVTIPYVIESPGYPFEYPNRANNSYVISQPLAAKMQVHFDFIYLHDNQDKIELYDQNGQKQQTISGRLASNGFSSDWISGNKITVKFTSGRSNRNPPNGISWGFATDQYLYKALGEGGDRHFIESRLKVATDAIIYVIEETRGKINWAIFRFDKSGNADGGEQVSPLNASFNDDADKQNLINHLESATATGGTPLGESLQDIYNYYGSKTQQVYKGCNKSFVITLTDGYPTWDGDWSRIPGVDFSDNTWNDGVDFSGDPSYGSAPNYYDDVARYMYERSWPDDSAVKYTGSYSTGELIPASERDDTPDNIVTHNIGFNSDNPMLQHAANVAGGIYITAYSKSQLMSAFYSLGLLIAEYSSYTAPVVSVDESNRVQSGDQIYTAVFKPLNDGQWVGNLKKYGLLYGDRGCSPIPTNEWFLVDKDNNQATDCDGTFIEAATSFWSPTANDGGQVDQGGAGQLIKDAIPEASTFTGPLTKAAGNISFRPLYTFAGDNSTLVEVGADTISNTDLGVATDQERYKIINYLYGYTYDATANGAPALKRSWPLNAVIHSSPEIVDYVNSNGELANRYIVVGANDGLLHIFDDTDGSEKLAILPPEVMGRLQDMDPAGNINKVYTVDGPIIQALDSAGNRLLIFGLRRGGRAYYAIDISDADPANWTIKWTVSNSKAGFNELGYSWARPAVSRLKIGEEGDPVVDLYKNVLIIPGGYDPNEDNFSEGADYDLVIPTEPTATGATTPRNSMGKAIFIVDLDDGSLLDFGTDTDYPFATNEKQFVWPTDPAWIDNNFESTRAQMRYSFVADPTVINNPASQYLQAAYLTDLFGQVWKIHASYDNSRSPKVVVNLDLIFRINPLTDQHSAYHNRANFETWTPSSPLDPRGPITPWPGGYRVGSGAEDKKIFITNPRKTFMRPEVSFAGNCYTDVPVLFLGTGDRVHPKFIGTHNGVYSFYDAHAYYNYRKNLGDPAYTSTYDYTTDIFSEADLLNVSGGGLEPDVELDADSSTSSGMKSNMLLFLRYNMKGWYTLLDPELGSWDSEFPFLDDDGDHAGDKVISPMNLFSRVLYTPTYQPLGGADPCGSGGKARLRAVDYCTGNAAYNFYNLNDDYTDPDEPLAKYSRLDRYLGIGSNIPSGVTILVRNGKPEGFLSIDDKIIKLPEIKYPKNLLPIYWRQLRE